MRRKGILPTAAERALAIKQLTVPTEAAFQRQVMEYAGLRGWRPYSIPDSRRATARGFPDLTLLHVGDRAAPLDVLRFAFWELKDETYQPSVDQVVWMNALSKLAKLANAAAGYEVLLVALCRPRHQPLIHAYLDGHGWQE